MSPARRTVRQTLTIARRDFIATVFTPVFLLFLFAPAIMVMFATISTLGARAAGGSSTDRARIVAIAPTELARPLAATDARLRAVFRPGEAPPPLVTLAPRRDLAAQAHAAFEARDYDAVAVLFGPLDHPHILYGPSGTRSSDYLAALAGATLADRRLGPPARAFTVPVHPAREAPGTRHPGGFAAVFGVFFLTLFLAGQVVGTMAEERNNKVIEVLAAAVPLESVFLGKLVGMFGVAMVFVGFWGVLLGLVRALLPPALGEALAGLHPAVGAIFPILFFAYFTMAYMLLGAVFLGVGAQATTPREIQMLSLPITLLQVAMFGLSSAAAAHPGSRVALAAELFPLSSPFAMAGHAANAPGLWPHMAALAWQALWVAIFIAVGARLFRRGVLQSGSARPRWFGRKREPATPEGTAV